MRMDQNVESKESNINVKVEDKEMNEFWFYMVSYTWGCTDQAMFRAIGIGYSRSLPAAAALNWVLKDGLGRLSRCIYTASLASAFDTNLKVGTCTVFWIAFALECDIQGFSKLIISCYII